MTFHDVTTGTYPSGRRVWIFARAGRWWAHLELGRHAWHVGTEPRRSTRLARWQRRRGWRTRTIDVRAVDE